MTRLRFDVPASCKHVRHGICPSCKELVLYIGGGPEMNEKDAADFRVRRGGW